MENQLKIIENKLNSEFINKRYITLYDVYMLLGLEIPMRYIRDNSLTNPLGIISYENYLKSVGWIMEADDNVVEIR